MTGINSTKIIQNLEFVNSFGPSSLAFFLFWFFIFAIWVRCKPVGPRRWEGAEAVGVFSLLQLGPRIRNWDPIQPPPARDKMRVNKESRWRCWKVLRSEPRPTFGHYGDYACRFCHRASTYRKSKRPPVANVSLPQNCASNLLVGPIFANQCHQAQMAAPQNLSTHSQRDPSLGSPSQSNTLPQADRHSHLRLSRLSHAQSLNSRGSSRLSASIRATTSTW